MNEFKELEYRYGENLSELMHPVLYKHAELLNKLVDERVFGVFNSEEGEFYILECCDDWYSHTLTKEECLELSDMFKDIASHID